LVSGYEDGAMILWDISGVLGKPLPRDSKIALNHDGRILASGSCSKSEGSGCEIRLWDINTGQSVGAPLTGPTDKLADLAFSPDGRMLASGSCGKREGSGCAQGEIRLWNLSTGQSLGGPVAIPMHLQVSLAFSPDGHTLLRVAAEKKENSAVAQKQRSACGIFLTSGR
jgi:WD40 repeat protein